MGLEAGALAALLLKAGGEVGASAFAPSPFQPRESFHGTRVDPVNTLGDALDAIRSVLSGVIERAGQPVDLSDAVVHGGLPTLTGGGLPSPIGMTTGGFTPTAQPGPLRVKYGPQPPDRTPIDPPDQPREPPGKGHTTPPNYRPDATYAGQSSS